LLEVWLLNFLRLLFYSYFSCMLLTVPALSFFAPSLLARSVSDCAARLSTRSALSVQLESGMKIWRRQGPIGHKKEQTKKTKHWVRICIYIYNCIYNTNMHTSTRSTIAVWRQQVEVISRKAEMAAFQ
jgi:hypothetical protein